MCDLSKQQAICKTTHALRGHCELRVVFRSNPAELAERVDSGGIHTKNEVHGRQPVIIQLPEIKFIVDKQGKPVGMLHHNNSRAAKSGL